MKIFKIKFDSKDPTDRSISVKKGDDFGIAIQIDNSATQGPSKLLYAGQEVEANKDLIEGYNVFLLKAIKDSTISVKDIDSQVIFTLNILAKDSDVVELGGTGGGESVWQAEGADYYIDAALSVNNCQKVTITGANDQVILRGLCDDASYEIKLGNLILNTPKGIQINGTCDNDAPYIGNINDCGRKTSYIDFSCGCLNLATNSGGSDNNAININTSGICIDAQQGNLYLNSSNNTLSIHGNNVAVCASTVKINGYTEFDVMVNNNKINIDTNCGRNCILIYSSKGTLNTNVKCTTLSSTGTTNIYADNVNITSRNTISANGQAVKLETLSSQSYIMVGLPGCQSSYAEKYIGIKSDWIETCAGEQYSTFVCGQQVIDSTYRSDAKINQFGNCNMATGMFATKFSLYTTGAGNIMSSDYYTVKFSNPDNTTTVAGNNINICTTSGGITLNATGSGGLCINANCIRMMYGCGWQVFSANPNANCIAIGNCSKTLELDANDLYFYVPNGKVDVNATNLKLAAYTTYFSDCTNYHSVYAISQSGYCGTSYQTINYPISGKTTITWDGVSYSFKNKTLAIVLSAIENTFLTGQDITYFDMGQAETAAFNKLTSIFSA